MVSNFSERGEGRTGFTITLVLFLVALFVAVKIVPVRIDGYNFRETLREEARFASIHRNDQDVRDRILDKAATLQIPLDPGDLTIRRTTSQVIINASYEQPIDLKVTTYVYKFETEQRAPLF